MAYSIETFESVDQWFALINFTIPDFSHAFDIKALRLIRKQIAQIGAVLVEPEYSFMIGDIHDSRLEVVAARLYVAIVEPVETQLPIDFQYHQGQRTLIRIHADSFEDVHTGMAEWMHDNDYIADGNVRRILVDNEHAFVYECPVKKSDI